jgi:hypothetical protein
MRAPWILERYRARKVDAAGESRCRNGWFDELASSRAKSLLEIVHRERVSARCVGHLLRVAFLAPTLVEAIAAGRQPIGLAAASLTGYRKFSPIWSQQTRDHGWTAGP